MADREKVIKGLEELSSFLFQAYSKVQAEEANLFYERFLAVDNALKLLKEQDEQIKNRDESLEKAREEIKWLRGMLKEQEAVVPIPPTDESDLWRCGGCGHQLFRCTHQRYCEMCGQEVKWEGR